MRKCLFVMCHLAIYGLGVNSNKTVLGNVIKDFLLLQKSSPKVALFLCWEKGAIVKLSKTLQEANYYVATVNLPHNTIPVIKPVTKQLFVLDADCDGYNNVLHEANLLKLFQLPYEWLIFANSTSQISSYLEILLDSKFYIVAQKTQTSFHVQAVYKIPSEAEYITNDIGIWRSGRGFEYYKFLSTVRNRTNLMGRPLNISLVLFHPDTANHLTDYRDKYVDGLTKFCYACVNKVAQTMNVSENLFLRREFGYYNQSTKLYTGMMGDLKLRQAELAGSAAYITPERMSFVDYIAAATEIRSVFIFRKPPLSYVANIYTLPFDKAVWLVSFVLICIVPLTVYVVVKWEWLNPELYGLEGKTQNVLRLRFVDVVLMELGAVCQQGAEAEPRSNAGRIATISIFMAFMFLYTSHSANIVGLLQSTSDSIRTVEDLLTSNIKLGAENFSYTRQYFRMQTEPIRKAIYAQKIAPKGQTSNYFNLESGVGKVRREFFAFLAITTNAYKVVADTFQENEKCSLREIDYWGLKPPHYAIRKNSSYKELIKVGFRKVHESGIQSCEANRLCTEKPTCQSEGGSFKNVELIDCYFAFVIFAAGVGISLIILGMECTYKIFFDHR